MFGSPPAVGNRLMTMKMRSQCWKLARATFAAVLVWCLLVEIAEFVAARLFNMELDGDWYLLLTGSSFVELCEFARQYAWPLAGALLAFGALVALVSLLAFRTTRRIFLLVVVLAVALAGARTRAVGSWRSWKPIYVAFDTIRGMRLYGRISRAGEWTAERAGESVRAPEGATNYVFVIGESMTSKRLSFYGYEKHTTPALEALGDRLAKLGPIRAVSPYTVISLAKLFIHGDESAPVRFRRKGYRTLFVGAHHRWARYCSVESSIFAACERKVYLSEERKGEHIYDEMLLPYVKEMVAGREPFALFVHIMGSHFDPKDRVPAGFAANEGLDDYDRSIRYTDKILAEIIALLPPRTVLHYIPDHGESTDLERWRDMNSEALWSVPMFVYPSENRPARVGSVADFSAMWYNLPQW